MPDFSIPFVAEHKNENDEIMNKIQIYSTDDEKLKFLGQMLNSDTSRKILQLLIQNEMTSNEIADSCGLSLSLVIHHVNKMMQSGIVTISNTTVNSKNQPMKYYTAKSGIVILPEKASAKSKESKSFSNSLKSIMKFASIGVAGLVSWFIVQFKQDSEISLDRAPYPGTGITEHELLSMIIPLSVIAIGLLVQFLLNQYKRKKVIS